MINRVWLLHPPIAGRYYTDRCDVFSFGMMVWEMLARRRPMLLGTRKGNNMAILYAMANGEPSCSLYYAPPTDSPVSSGTFGSIGGAPNP